MGKAGSEPAESRMGIPRLDDPEIEASFQSLAKAVRIANLYHDLAITQARIASEKGVPEADIIRTIGGLRG